MELTKELIKFCRKNLRELSPWLDHSDWGFQRIAKTHWDNLSSSIDRRLADLGLEGMRGDRWNSCLTIKEVMAALGAMKALADAGSLEALEALFEVAKFSAHKVRAMQRKQYLEDHRQQPPWKAKPAERYGEALVNARASRIDDSDVNRMLQSVEREIADAADGANGQEGRNA